MLLSLFSGCGGLDLGFEAVGFEIGLAYDLRSSSIESWNHNRQARSRGRVADLLETGLTEMDAHHGGIFDPIGVIGGPPCQSFSRANSSRSHDDPRSKLVGRFFSIALDLHRRRPLDFILMENVPELNSEENCKVLEREINKLRRHGFSVQKFQADAAFHSVPQNRNRLFALALPKDAMKRWSKPEGESEKKTVEDAIGGLPEPVRFRRGIKPDDIEFHRNHWCMAPKSRKFFDGSLAEGHTSTRSFKTLAWKKPSITVSYGHREVHVHPDGKRRLSVLEAMRLQGFPDDYVLKGSLSAQIDQVSEAVPPPLAEAVAASIMSALETTAKETTVYTSINASNSGP